MSRELSAIIKHYSLARKFGIGVTGILTILSFVAVCCPMANGEVNATSSSSDNTTSSGVNSSIAIAVGDNVDLPITFGADGTGFVTGSTTVTINSTNVKSYSISIGTADGTSNLNPQTEGVTRVIGAPNSSLTSTNYRNNLNTWGYALATGAATSTTAYSAVPGTATEIAVVESPTTTESHSLNFALSADSGLPAGEYSNSVVITAIATPRETTLADISTMQQMTPEICQATPPDTSKELIDTRDENSYHVQKLLDGNCWMVEDLNLTLTPGGLSVDDTDIAEDWNMTSTHKPAATWPFIAEVNTKNTDGHVVQSWKLDEQAPWVYYSFNAAHAGTYIGSIVGNGSICPKGWQLPPYDENANKSKSFAFLLRYYSSDVDRLISEPLNFSQAGIVAVKSSGGGISQIGGAYWDQSGLAFMLLNTGNVNLKYETSFANGLLVRCVAR